MAARAKRKARGQAGRAQARPRAKPGRAPRSGDASKSGSAGGPSGVRLQKLIASAGLASRRAAEEWIEQGRVTVNGRLAQLGDRADLSRDRVELDGESLVPDKPIYWMLNKPRGVVTTLRDPHGRPTVLDSLPSGLLRQGRVFPVGRLDVDTEGLLLLTNDGALAHVLLHPSLGSEREYRVTVRGELDARARSLLERGVPLEDGRTAPAQVRALRVADDGETTTFHLILHEGRKRQIRRSLYALRHPVKKLARVRMGPLRLGRLPRGECRPLEPHEVAALLRHRAELEQKIAAHGGKRGRTR